MSRENGMALDRGLSEVGEAERKCWRLGWEDGWARRPYPRRYDQWLKEPQIVYEAGRLFAANVRSAGLIKPEWDGSNRCGLITRAINRAERLVGAAVPESANA